MYSLIFLTLLLTDCIGYLTALTTREPVAYFGAGVLGGVFAIGLYLALGSFILMRNGVALAILVIEGMMLAAIGAAAALLGVQVRRQQEVKG